MNQKIVFFEGPSCAGKSTAVDMLFQNHPNIFRISKDSIKRLISNYSHNDEAKKIMLEKMLINMCEVSLDAGMSLFVESQKHLVDKILEVSNSRDVDIKYVNIEAPLEVLIKRFSQRKQDLQKIGIDLPYSYEDKLLGIYYDYKNSKISDALTLDTSLLSKQEVVDEIEKYLGYKS